MDAYTLKRRDHGFVIGLLAGAVAGAGAAMWLAPRLASRLRQQRDDVADAVVRGAQEVERFATAAKSDHIGRSGEVAQP
jgi:gas vesicle protein